MSNGILKARDLRCVPSYVDDVVAMADFLMEELTSLGVKAEKRSIGTHVIEGKEKDLPPVIIGELGNDPNKVKNLMMIPMIGINALSRKLSLSTATMTFNRH